MHATEFRQNNPMGSPVLLSSVFVARGHICCAVDDEGEVLEVPAQSR